MSDRKGELYRGQSGGDNPSEDLGHTRGMINGTIYEYYEDSASGNNAERLTAVIANAREEANMDVMPGFQGPTTSTELFEHTPARLDYWGATTSSEIDMRERGEAAIEADIARNQGQRMMLRPEDVPLSNETNYLMADEREHVRGLASRGTWQHIPIQKPVPTEPDLGKILGESSPLSKQQFFDQKLPSMEDY